MVWLIQRACSIVWNIRVGLLQHSSSLDVWKIRVGLLQHRTILTHGSDGDLPWGPTSIGAPITHAKPCPIDGTQLLLS